MSHNTLHTTGIPFVDVHTHNNAHQMGTYSIRNIFIQETHDNHDFQGPVSIGIHPWHLSFVDIEKAMAKLAEAACCSNVMAIGETGIDKTIHVPQGFQREVFLRQIEISETVKKPVILHCVKATAAIMEARAKKKHDAPWIYHGFNGNPSMASTLIGHGIFPSFGPSILQDKAPLMQCIRSVPLEAIFLETDDKEIDIEKLYTRVAAIKGVSLGEVKERIYQNFSRCFNYDK